MTYLIFKGTKFIGHTEDKKVVKRFLKERKNKYRVDEIETQLISSEFRNSDEFTLRELSVFEHYDKVLTQQDLIDLTYVGKDRLNELMKRIEAVGKQLKCIKLEDDEEEILKDFFEMMEDIKEDLQSPETCVFIEDYFDMDSIIELIIAMK